MFESEAGRGLLLPLLGALFAGGIVTLFVLAGPEQSSSALHQSNHSLLSTCGRLHTEALRAHSVAEAALSQLQAEAEVISSRCLRDAEDEQYGPHKSEGTAEFRPQGTHAAQAALGRERFIFRKGENQGRATPKGGL